SSPAVRPIARPPRRWASPSRPPAPTSSAYTPRSARRPARQPPSLPCSTDFWRRSTPSICRANARRRPDRSFLPCSSGHEREHTMNGTTSQKFLELLAARDFERLIATLASAAPARFLLPHGRG